MADPAGDIRLPELRLPSASTGYLDSFDWRAGETLLSHAVRFGIRATEERAVPHFLAVLPAGWKRSSVRTVDRLYSCVVGGSPSEPHLLYDNEREIGSTADLEEIAERFQAFLHIHIAEHSPNRTFLHAGAVGWRGRAIVLPGRSGAGKTTLTAELVRAGASYLSDDFAPIDGRGRVHPFPKLLAVRENGETRELPAEAFGGRQSRLPLPVGLVVLSSYAEGRGFRPRSLSPGRAVIELLKTTASARRQPARAFDRLSNLVQQAPVLRGVRGEAAEAAEAILERSDV